MIKRRVLFWGFKPLRELLQSSLGIREQQVIDVVWRRGSATVRDVQRDLPERPAYTTVMTTLDRLYRKGLLTRTKASRMFVYSAAQSRQELETSVAAEIIADLLSGDVATPPQPLLSNFVDAVGNRDRELLDELERLVRAKRERLRKGSPS